MKTPIIFSVISLLMAAVLFQTDVDDRLYKAITQRRIEKIDNPMVVITQLASAWFLTPICIMISILYFFYSNLWFIVIPITTAISSMINTLLKGFFKRHRPTGKHLVEETSYSFPSGHAMAAGTFYTLLATMIHTLWNFPFIFFICGAVMALVAFSRVHLGVHYPVDVLVGLGLGLLISTASIHVFFVR